MWIADNIPDMTGKVIIVTGATASGVQRGQFFGPDGFMEIRGNVTEVQAAPEAHDPAIARRLWNISEQLTSVAFLTLDEASLGKTEG